MYAEHGIEGTTRTVAKCDMNYSFKVVLYIIKWNHKILRFFRRGLQIQNILNSLQNHQSRSINHLLG